MSGTIATLQKCPSCGGKFSPSKGDFPIVCDPCRTQPTKFVIKLYWQKKMFTLSRDREGRTIRSWHHAVNLLGNIRSEIQAGTFDPEIYKKQSSTLFSNFWESFRSNYEGKISTYAKLKTVGIHLEPLMHLQMRDIRAFHINDWWKAVKKKKLSPHYMNDIQQWLKKFLVEARSLDIIERVPNFPDALPQPKKPIEWLSRQNQQEVLGYIPEHDKHIFNFLFLTGVRVGEAIGLQRSDIDFPRGRTIIQHTIKRDRRTLGPTKNQAPRIIPHISEIELCLKDAVKQTGPHKYVFINKWGRKYSADYLRKTFREACKKANVKIIPLKNGTRHSFGMRLIESGVDIWTTSKAMGHADIKMTENYVEMLADRLSDAYEKGSCNNAVTLKKDKI